MKKPRYTDAHKYPHGYSRVTDLAATFARVRRELQAQARKKPAKVVRIKDRSNGRS